MISPKFVKIAREVIKFIRNGSKLKYSSIYFFDNKTCPLGAVCVNHKCDFSFCEDMYDFARKITGFSYCFEEGFDYFKFIKAKLVIVNDEYFKNEDFMIGFRFAEMCDKRNWIVD